MDDLEQIKKEVEQAIGRYRDCGLLNVDDITISTSTVATSAFKRYTSQVVIRSALAQVQLTCSNVRDGLTHPVKSEKCLFGGADAMSMVHHFALLVMAKRETEERIDNRAYWMANANWNKETFPVWLMARFEAAIVNWGHGEVAICNVEHSVFGENLPDWMSSVHPFQVPPQYHSLATEVPERRVMQTMAQELANNHIDKSPLYNMLFFVAELATKSNALIRELMDFA